MTAFSLHPFPGQDSDGVSIQGTIARTGQAIILSFFLQGNLDDLVLPAATEQARCDNLWQATCLEMFWAEEGKKNYWELNLAPNGAWNIYAFSDSRTDMRQEERMAAPAITTTRTPESFSLTAELDIAPLHTANTPLRVGINAVLQHRDTRLSYWALAHPEAKPNFHTPQAFLLRL
ncbi:MAG: DOMON-like domain-containing protein [Deltaproteobacteria bacterium]|nr:DOMON-like domain-containing protein [Deltaproteobacteria bacterium]